MDGEEALWKESVSYSALASPEITVLVCAQEHKDEEGEHTDFLTLPQATSKDF